jgi:hypothetical protein
MFGFGFGGFGRGNPRLRMFRMLILAGVVLVGLVFHSSTASSDVRLGAEALIGAALVVTVLARRGGFRSRETETDASLPTVWPLPPDATSGPGTGPTVAPESHAATTDVAPAGTSDTATAGRSDTAAAGRSDTATAGRSDTAAAGRSDIAAAGTPEVTIAGTSEVATTRSGEATSAGADGRPTSSNPQSP